jgi:hypothetical protein
MYKEFYSKIKGIGYFGHQWILQQKYILVWTRRVAQDRDQLFDSSKHGSQPLGSKKKRRIS